MEGLPNLQDLGRLLIGEDVPELLGNDLQVCLSLRDGLAAGVKICEARQDYVSRDLLEKLVQETEEQIDWLESQRWLIEQSGLANFLQSMM